jgi:mannose-6-phosphate isomerase-like protein (cupin superfamily)
MKLIGGAGAYTTPKPGELNEYVTHLSVPDLSVGTYSIPAGGEDDQTPHTEDEIYVVTSGRARIVTDEGEVDVKIGDVIFVPADEGHRFVDIAEDLALLVIFAPAYKSRAAG